MNGGGDTPSPTPITGPESTTCQYASSQNYMMPTAYGVQGSANVLPMVCVLGTYGDVPNTTRCFYLVKTQGATDWSVGEGDDIANEYADFQTPDQLAAEVLGSLTGTKKAVIVGNYTSEPTANQMKAALLAVYST